MLAEQSRSPVSILLDRNVPPRFRMPGAEDSDRKESKMNSGLRANLAVHCSSSKKDRRDIFATIRHPWTEYCGSGRPHRFTTSSGCLSSLHQMQPSRENVTKTYRSILRRLHKKSARCKEVKCILTDPVYLHIQQQSTKELSNSVERERERQREHENGMEEKERRKKMRG